MTTNIEARNDNQHSGKEKLQDLETTCRLKILDETENVGHSGAAPTRRRNAGNNCNVTLKTVRISKNIPTVGNWSKPGHYGTW